VGFVEGETGYCNETCVMCDVDGTGEVSIYEEAIDIKEEVSIKVEEAVDIKEEVSIKVEEAVDKKEEVSIQFEAVYIMDETPQTITFPPIRTEHEVRLWCVCVCVVTVDAFRPFIPPKMKL
jgi:hypothetical protein